MSEALTAAPEQTIILRPLPMGADETLLQVKFPAKYTCWIIQSRDVCAEIVGAKTDSVADLRQENIEFLARITVNGKEVLKIDPSAVSPENLGKICDLVRAFMGARFDPAQAWRDAPPSTAPSAV